MHLSHKRLCHNLEERTLEIGVGLSSSAKQRRRHELEVLQR